MLFKSILTILFLLITIQFIKIDLAASKKVDPKNEIQAPKKIKNILQRACYDCHSYQTNMPWYGNIAPISWEVRSHIKKGRKAVNFQEWGTYEKKRREKIYNGIAKSINFRMPLPSYVTLHPEAELTTEERGKIRTWAKERYIK